MLMTPILLQVLAILLTVGVFYVWVDILREALESLFKERSSRRNPHSSPRMELLGFRCLNRDRDFWSRILYQDEKRTLELQLCFDEPSPDMWRVFDERIHMSIFQYSSEERELASRVRVSHPKRVHRQTLKAYERHFSRKERLVRCVWSHSSDAKKVEFEQFLVWLERHLMDRATGLSFLERAPFMTPLLRDLLVTTPDDKRFFVL